MAAGIMKSVVRERSLNHAFKNPNNEMAFQLPSLLKGVKKEPLPKWIVDETAEMPVPVYDLTPSNLRYSPKD